MALDGPHPTLRALEGDNGIALYCRRDPGCNLGTGVQSLDIWTHTAVSYTHLTLPTKRIV